MRALTITQPWAWAIVRPDLTGAAREEALRTGWLKDIENRVWATSLRGLFYVHAGKGFDLDGYHHLAALMGTEHLPFPAGFDRGGIIGTARLVNCVRTHSSRWFEGPYGFVLREATPVPFRPLRGQQGFFEVDEEGVRG